MGLDPNCSLRKQGLGQGADRNILEMIEDMPHMEFENMADVIEGLR